MDDKILLIIILISGIYFYNSIMKKREMEHMTSITGTVYKVKKEDNEVEFSKVNLGKSIYFGMELEHLKKLPIIDSDTINNVVDIDLEKKLWSGKKISLYKIIKSMQEELHECGSDIKINVTNMENIKDRKDFIKMIPYFKNDILERINYESIKCFIKSREPSNLLNIIRLNNSIPALFDIHNSLIINNYLYKITYLGVVKYKLDIDIDIDESANILNASLESTLLNDINNHNNTNHLIIILKGEPYKLIDNKVEHLLTREVFQIDIPDDILKNRIDIVDDESSIIYDESKIIDDESNDNVEDELESIHDESTEEENIQITKKVNNKNIMIKSLFYIDDKLYFIHKNKVYPNKGIGLRLNYFIKSNDIYVRSVNNFYYYKNYKLNTRLIFSCSSNLFFSIENNAVSDLQYFDEYFKFKNTHNIDQDLNCNQYNSVLSQLKISNKINDDIKTNILKSLKCKF